MKSFTSGFKSKSSQDFLVVPWLRLCTPSARSPGSITGQGTRPHMPQLKIPVASTKVKKHSQINKYLLKSKNSLSVICPTTFHCFSSLSQSFKDAILLSLYPSLHMEYFIWSFVGGKVMSMKCPKEPP